MNSLCVVWGRYCACMHVMNYPSGILELGSASFAFRCKAMRMSADTGDQVHITLCYLLAASPLH